MGEKGNFRGRLFGGFDRQDVIDYIESVSIKKNLSEKERDDLREELDRCRSRVYELESEKADLRSEIEELRKELEQERDRTATYKAEKLREADEVVDKILAEVGEMKADVTINLTNAQCELKRLDKALSAVSSVFTDAEAKISALKGEIDSMKE